MTGGCGCMESTFQDLEKKFESATTFLVLNRRLSRIHREDIKTAISTKTQEERERERIANDSRCS